MVMAFSSPADMTDLGHNAIVGRRAARRAAAQGPGQGGLSARWKWRRTAGPAEARQAGLFRWHAPDTQETVQPEDTMNITARALATGIATLTGVALIAAGPVMIYEGVHGQHEVTSQLSEQLVSFPAKGSAGLPAAEAGYAGRQVTTGPLAKAYADMIETHIKEQTGGRTFSQVSSAAIANPNDTKLAALKQTAFMGESLRGSLLGAYQAWEVTYLVTGLGLAFLGIGAATLAVTGLTEAARRKVHVPDTVAALAENPSSGQPLL
jgi:hypothetical protein